MLAHLCLFVLSSPLAARVALPWSEPSPQESAGSALAEPQALPFDARELRGLALLHARDGRLEVARQRFAELLASELGEEERARGERDAARLEAWTALRLEFLQRAIETGEELTLPLRGKALHGRVEALEEDVLVLVGKRIGKRRIPLEALDSYAVARSMRQSVEAYSESWVRYWPYALEADKRWKRLVGRATPAARSLREDGDEYSELVALGDALHRMEELTARVPRTPKLARAIVRDLNGFIRYEGKLPAVVRRRAQLEQAARLAFGRLFDDVPRKERLRGQLDRSGGRVRLAYDFRDEGQLEDFLTADDHLFARERFPKLDLDGRSVVPAITSEGLTVLGEHCLAHLAQFTPPVALKLQFRLGEPQSAGADAWHFLCALGVAPSRGHYGASANLIDLDVADVNGHRVIVSSLRSMMAHDHVYTLELDLDAEGHMETRLDGQKVAEAKTTSLGRGELRLFFHTEYPVHLRSLSASAAEDEVFDRSVRESWIQRRVAGLWTRSSD